MNTIRKYPKDLIEIILSELNSGASVKDLSEKYSVDRRRISEWKSKDRKFVEVQAVQNVKTSESVEKSISNTSKTYMTIEDILDKNGISKNEWEVLNASINNWDDASGTTHYQTKVNLVKKVVNLRYEIPAPIKITVNQVSSSNKLKKSNNLKCAVILPDMQVGFRRNLNTGELVAIHDREAMDVALQLTEFISPDRIVLLGDNLDLAEFSTKYTTPADMSFTTQASLVELSWWLGKIRSINLDMKIDYIAGNHECFSEDTEILTKSGFKKYYEILDGEMLGTLNKETLSIEYQNFTHRQVYDYSGEMHQYSAKSVDLLVTPNHRMYFGNGNKNSKFKMIESKDVLSDDSRKVLYVSGINNNDDYNISDEMIKLIGWVVTDGSTYSDSNFKSIRLYQSEKKVKLITNILDKLGFKYSVSCRDRVITEICGKKLIKPIQKQYVIYVSANSSKEIYKFIEDKYSLPEWTYLLSSRQFDLFHKALILGDGTIPKTSKKSSVLYGVKDLLEQVQKLYIHNGYRAFIKQYRDIQYKLNITNTNTATFDRIKNHKEIIKYDGIVWDFTVPNDTLVVRRNGKVAITGNCRIERFIDSKANILSGLRPANKLKGHASLSVPSLLGLDDLDIEYHDYPKGKVALNSNLVCVHGEVAKGMSGATVSELVKSARVSVIQGHIHRHEIATKTTWDAFNNSYQYTAASFGCLCRIDPGYVPGMKYLQNWQNGIGVVWYEEDGLEQFRMEYIPIIKGRSIYNTEVFESNSEDIIALNIEKDTKFKVT